MKHLCLIFALIMTTSVVAKDIIVKSEQTRRLTSGDLSFENSEYHLNLNNLVLENDSVLLIPDFLAGKTLNVTVKNLIAKGRTLIVQPLGGYFQDRDDPTFYNYWDKHPRAASGEAVGDRDQALTMENGQEGYPGKNGKTGRSSVRLKMNLGISVIQDLLIVLKSESGGHGGKGGTGQQGGGAECDPISGGDGGNGGKGGPGGKGGFPGNVKEIDITWHANAPVLSSNKGVPLGLSIKQLPGLAGTPGLGGDGGKRGGGKSCFVTRSRDAGEDGADGDLGAFPRSDVQMFYGRQGKVTITKELK